MIDFYNHHPKVQIDLVRHGITHELCFKVTKTTDELVQEELWGMGDFMRLIVTGQESVQKARDALNSAFDTVVEGGVPLMDEC